MRIGVAKEIKPQEYRVALTPAGARELVQRGHEVVVEAGAGAGSQFPDADYEANGARIGSVDEVWESAELLLKVKEPIAPEYRRLREGLSDKAFADYDVALIDCAPNFGLMAKNAVAASDMLVIPTRPDYLSINGIDSLGRKVQAFAQEYNEQLGEAGDNGAPLGRPPAAVIFTMVQLHDNQPIESQRSYISRVSGLGVPTFQSTVRDSKAVYGPAPEYGVPVILAGTGRALTRELRDLVSEMVAHLDEVAT